MPAIEHVHGLSLHAIRTGCVIFVALAAGCAGLDPKPPAQIAKSTASTEAPAPASSVAPAKAIPPTVVSPAPVVPPSAKPPATAPIARDARSAVGPPATAQAKSPPTPGPSAKKDSGAAPAPLNLASLEQRLKDTKAIGVFTKITLKNQVDDLLGRFRAFYQGTLKTSLAELRGPYDLLLLKVLSLLQDSDPSLASAIVASREAIWGLLSDPKKFATI